EDGRIVVVKTGTFTLRTADTFDTGLYHCIGTNHNDADTLTFRITVLDPHVERDSVNGAQLSVSAGSTLYLPCTSAAVPDAAISWVLPEHVILHHSARNKQIFDNGTLRIQGVTERDGGYFRCVAANQYGVDLLVFQVLVRKNETTLKKKQVDVGEWEEGDGSGNAMLASPATQNRPSAPVATLAANQEPAASAARSQVAQSAHKRTSNGKMPYRHYRDKISRRFRGHRRQFVSSARRVDPQRWAAFLEKTKRNSTSIEKRGEVATKPPIQARKVSKIPGDEEEASGDLISPEEEFMIPVTERAAVSALGRPMESVVTAGPGMTTSTSPAARKTSLLVAEAVTPLPSPFSQSVSSDSRRQQTYLKPTATNSRERPDRSQVSANGVNQSVVSHGVSRTPTPVPAGQRLVYSGLKSGSATPMADVTDTSKPVTSQDAVDKLRVFTESIDKISTQIDNQISVGTVSEPSPELGHIYFRSTQKQVTPKPPLDSTIVTHQQIQDVTTRTPQAQQQYGRRRKISGRRRIVRPGRIPSMKEHRYSFGRPGSVRGSTAVAADVQLNMKYVSNLPTLNNLSSSINPLNPEAPLSSPSTMNMSLEHAAGTHQNTAFLREEQNKASTRQKATTGVTPLITKGTQDTPQWKLETSAPFQTNTDGVQPSSIRQPTAANHTAHMVREITHPMSTKISSALEPVSPSSKPRTSEKNSQRGKITWEHLVGNGAQKEVLLQKPPKQQTDRLLSAEVSTVLPKTTAALSTSIMSPSHLTPISTGGNQSSGFLSLTEPVRYGVGKSGEHLPTAKPQSHSRPATSTTEEIDVTSLKPTVIPIITPHTDAKPGKSKTFRAGRKRGQRRKRPPKTSPAHSVTAGRSTAAVLSANTATPGLATAESSALPTSLSPAKPPPESVSTVSATGTPALRTLGAPESPQHVPVAATQAALSPVTWRNVQSPTLPPNSHIAQSPTTAPQTTPLRPEPVSTTVCATPASEPAQQTKATTMAGEKAHLKMEERVTQENHTAQPTFPGRTGSSTRTPAASTDISPPSTRHPTPPP
ncbi:IGS10 protein, partial [Chordeiles acutipennis]|nr:IGS10 protein [Chordeiles acutipennis]